jgi:3-oxoacyl-(acyl-carrier-protein) synthase/thioesterase domain-containing protein/acyl carrier protein
VRDEAALRAVRGRRSLPSPGFDSDPIVIVGMAGRFPGSPNLDAYWANLRSNADLICDVPPERWRWQDYYGDPQAEPGKTRARWGGFIEEVDKFDCRFFGISPREAELMDPQQRLFVETVWAAIEDSGTDPSTLSGAAVGVFVGGGSSDYLELLRESEGGLRPHMVTGNVTTFLANRVSYLLNLRGPSQPIETACSASLIAVHRAVQAIRAGECDMALAGGVNLILTPTVTLAFSTMGVISPQGRCRVFDRGADGYVRGEGVGAVFLMRQSRALRDGNPIHAVIKGSGENHGGHANSLTAPSPAGLKELLVRTYKAADVDPRTVNYVEAHGTGTVLGDPIEIAALTESFAQLGVASGGAPDIEGRSCAIGSVKANIGHLETAAGIASVIKVALMLRHRAVPANGLLREQNEYIDLTGTPFRLPTETCEWLPLRDARGVALPRRAGISSFGAGGSNAHLILEEASGARSEGTERASPAPSVVLPISARTPERLREYVHRVSQFVTNALERPGSLNIADLAYTFQAGRNAMRFRAAFVAADLDTLADKMRAFLARQGHGGEAAPGSPGDVLSVDQDWRAGAGFELADMVERWLGGERVDWRALHSGETRARISAPTYPFERVHCWAAAPKRPSLSGSGNLAAQPEPVADERRREAVLQLLHEATKHPLDEISESQRLTDLGIDSIMALALKADVERLFDTVLSATDLGVMTVRELVALVGDADSAVARNVEGRPALPLQGDLVTRQLRKYPELQVLQKHGERPATFWFYSGFGTVQPYISLAEALTGVLPFLAFQASGITGAKKPFRTINDIAKYHAEVIRELQPSGDFQLGGYSFGGVLAYECARELQLAGGNVRSIVLLDSFYPGVPFPEISNRTALLLTFMVFLKTQGLPIGDLAAEHVRDDELERYLVELGVRRGLKYTHDEFLAIFRKFLHLVDDRMLSDYRPLSLPRPQDVHALYFRRSDPGRFFAASMGEAGPRGAVDEVASNLPADEIGRVNREFAVNDAGAWRSVLPVIEMHVTAAPDHFSLLDDPRSFELIANKLRELYGTASI